MNLWMKEWSMITASWRFSTVERRFWFTNMRAISSPGLCTTSWTSILCQEQSIYADMVSELHCTIVLYFSVVILTYCTIWSVFCSILGQSEYNSETRLGGDSELTECGQEYSEKLGRWVSYSLKLTFSSVLQLHQQPGYRALGSVDQLAQENCPDCPAYKWSSGEVSLLGAKL